MRDEIVSEISVCSDCMILDANGEAPQDRDPNEPEPWSALPFGYQATMGGDHNEDCPNRLPYNERPDDIDCDCGDLGYRQSSCDGCGSHLHGDRYQYTLWRTTIETARGQHSAAIRRVREFRADPVLRAERFRQFDAMACAAEWRTYLAERYAEQSRWERWLTAWNQSAA